MSTCESDRVKEQIIPLFGLGIAHSRAPMLHNFIFAKLGLPWKYVLFDSDNVESFKENYYDDFFACAVTMPNKIIMTQHVDSVDEGAVAVGAINTIYSRTIDGNKVKIGTNTDTIGIRDAILFNSPQISIERAKGKPGLVYGGGGASRSAVYALVEYLGCSKVYIINRFKQEVESLEKSMVEGGFKGQILHVETPEQAQNLEVPNLIVCTIPDFAPTTLEEIRAKSTLDVFKKNGDGVVLEMCYHPNPKTRLYQEFQESNWFVISGIEAMIYQAFAQQVLWTGYNMKELHTKEAIEYVYNNL
ncbi:hypothetical protein CAAN3_07S02762 [[Candida] anglica]